MIETTGEAFDALHGATHYLAERVDDLIDQKNAAYAERNQLVAALSKLFPSHLMRHPESDPEWNDEWRWIVCIELPTGQATWHIHDSELNLFNHLEEKPNNWDGHGTVEKYNRLQGLLDKVNVTSTQPELSYDATAINRMIADYLGFSVVGPPYYSMQQWNYPEDWSRYIVSRPVTYLPDFIEMILKYKEILESISPQDANTVLPKVNTFYAYRKKGPNDYA